MRKRYSPLHSMESHTELEKMTKEDIMRMLQRVACPMLRGRSLHLMTKQMMIDHLVKSKCPELAKLIRIRRPSTSGSESSGHSLNHK
jgi:hypothetical protein